MNNVLLCVVLTILLARSVEPGTPCPAEMDTKTDCFCSFREDGITVIVCPEIHNATHLEEVTRPLKSLVIDRFVLLNVVLSFPVASNDSENEIDPKGKPFSPPSSGTLPKKWLSEMKVRDVEIQRAKLDGFFLTDDAFDGQSDYLLHLVVKNANLKGHLCASCAPGYLSVSTKALRKTPLLRLVDLTGNELEVLDGNVFPSNLKELSVIKLANNKIIRVHDNAFAGLLKLSHLDLSGNRLTSISRKIFKTPDSALKFLDLSYNAIQTLPDDMFHSLNTLKGVILSHNLLETLPTATWTRTPPSLEKIDVRGNFLVCNCSMSWVARRTSKNAQIYGYCLIPDRVEFQEITPTLVTLSSC